MDITCINCNNVFDLTPSTRYKRNYRKLPLDICGKCLVSKSLQNQHSKLSDEEKKIRLEKLNAGRTKYWNSPGVRNKHSLLAKKQWKSLPAEQKSATIQRLMAGQMEWKSQISEEELIKFYRRRAETLSSSWGKLSKKQKHARLQYLHSAQQIWWDNLSLVEKDLNLIHLFNGRDLYFSNPANVELLADSKRTLWKNLSDDEREKKVYFLRELAHTWWDKLSPEEKLQWGETSSKNMKTYWASLTPEEYRAKVSKSIEGYNLYLRNLETEPNRNESSLINYLQRHDIRYDMYYYNQTIHPEFDKLFPYNPVTKSPFVLPYHNWDFIIYGSNGKHILIDIDGSVHDSSQTDYMVTHKSGIKVKLSELIAFNDSQRAYQTDGYDAYIIKCLDDNLTERSTVFDLVRKSELTFKELIPILRLNQLGRKSFRSLIDKKSKKVVRRSTTIPKGSRTVS